jgi:hypothetical protein
MFSKLLAKPCSFLLASAISLAPVAGAQDGHHSDDHLGNRHVLLISIDGMHAVDFENCVGAGTCPTLAALGKTGVNYTRTTTPRPSDSFPGLMALVTGGSPRAVGAFYDVGYDRVLAPPKIATGNQLPGGDCVVGQIHRNSDGSTGTQTEYEEGNEFDETQLNGRPFPPTSPLDAIDGGVKSINPDRLVRDPFNNCQPVYSWNFVRTNTIFGVVHAAGGYTAWSDKHAAYASVSGPTGTDQPSNVDDYYSPEVNSLQIVLPGIKTAGLTPKAVFDCGTLVPNGGDWTTDFDAIKCNDQLKVNAVLNQIHGRTHLGTSKAPRPKMLAEIQFVDAAIGEMVAALNEEGLFDSTTFIITAKHGQSPIDPNRFFPIPGASGNNGTPPSGIIPNLLPAVYRDPNNGLGLAEDDISQIWLADSSRTGDAVTALENAATAIGLGQIYFGASLNTLFNPPGVPNNPGPCCFLRPGGDPRSPDIVLIPNVGVVYTGNLKKQSEHGGYAWDDTNVMLLVSNPHIHARTIHSFVETAQVAPTILEILGLDPDKLDAVRKEGTPVLPAVQFGDDGQR